jgi:hypothetical protein
MQKAMRVFFVTDTKDFTDQLLLEVLRKHVKGFLRLGHDTQVFSCNHALDQVSPIRSRSITRRLFKPQAAKLLTQQVKRYEPDIIHVSFSKLVDAETIRLMRQAAPNAFFLGIDVDLWPELHPGRVEAAKELDLLFTTYGPSGQQALRQAGVNCVFMPNACDPDIEHRYSVSEKWRSDVIFTGRLRHKTFPTEQIREDLITRLIGLRNSVVYGCGGRESIGGMQYFYALSGAKMGLSINAVNDIELYHSDRLTQYLACGTLVLSMRSPRSEWLFQDGVHLRYFDTVDEFLALVEQYLRDERERVRIADAGMRWAHREYNCEKIIRYMLDTVETGSYSAPWTRAASEKRIQDAYVSQGKRLRPDLQQTGLSPGDAPQHFQTDVQRL